jgi:hypothetical protein
VLRPLSAVLTLQLRVPNTALCVDGDENDANASMDRPMQVLVWAQLVVLVWAQLVVLVLYLEHSCTVVGCITTANVQTTPFTLADK